MKKRILSVMAVLSCVLAAACSQAPEPEKNGAETVIDMPDSETEEMVIPETLENTAARVLAERTNEPISDIFDIRMSADEAVSAFVFAGERTYDDPAAVGFEGSLWYVDETGAILLQDNLDVFDYEPRLMEYEGEKHLLFCDSSALPGYSETYFWGVREQKPELLFQTPNVCFLDSGGRLAAVKTFISNSANGRIWQRYYLYWNEEEQCYQEVWGHEITEEEYLSYENAQTVRDDIEAAIREEIAWLYGEDSLDLIEVTGYFKRDNGIVNINFRVDHDGQTGYRYAILEEADGVIWADTPSDSYSWIYESGMCEWGYISEMGGLSSNTN